VNSQLKEYKISFDEVQASEILLKSENKEA
jgi:hypothetical protein